jgi:centromeric protein E
VKEQALEIAELRKQLELRPQKPDEEVVRLKLEVDQMNEIISEWSIFLDVVLLLSSKLNLDCFAEDYENNMDEPSVKLREDVEAEWLPKVQKLEARAKERETFYKSLYNSVLELKSQKAQLKEVSSVGFLWIIHPTLKLTNLHSQRCQKLESICHEYIALHEPSQSEFDHGSNRGMSTSSSVSSPVASTISTFSSNQDDSHFSSNPYSSRVTSVSMAHLGSKLAMSNVGRNGGGLRSLKEDSSFDLVKQAALLEGDEEIF